MTEDHTCEDGWTDKDAARPCRICRPWHFACTTCGVSVRACHDRRTGKCCPRCPHTPPSLKTTRKEMRS
jgi:hypothetical protein